MVVASSSVLRNALRVDTAACRLDRTNLLERPPSNQPRGGGGGARGIIRPELGRRGSRELFRGTEDLRSKYLGRRLTRLSRVLFSELRVVDCYYG